jgi:hypothetical protein
VGSQILQFEAPAQKALGTWTDHDRVRRCEGLQSRRHVRRLSDHGLLVFGERACQRPGDDKAGFDTNPYLQGWTCRRSQAAHTFDHSPPGPYSPLGIVFMSPRVAEASQDAIAGKMNDLAVETGYGTDTDILEHTNEIPEILRIELYGQFRGPNEIAKQSCQMATLWALPDVPDGAQVYPQQNARWLGLVSRQRDNGLQEFLAVPEWDPESLKISVGEVRQNLLIDPMKSE